MIVVLEMCSNVYDAIDVDELDANVHSNDEWYSDEACRGMFAAEKYDVDEIPTKKRVEKQIEIIFRFT